MANITTQTIRVDLSTDKVIPSAFTHQNDTARTLEFSIYNKGMPHTMTGNTVKFAYKSPIVDGAYTVITGSGMASGTVSGNKVTVTLPNTYTAISGVGMLTMIITPTSGTVRPVNIRLVVQKSADGSDVMAGASDFPDAWMDEKVYSWLDDHIDGIFTEEQFTDAVDNWLDDHPEATTTVEDGSITKAKLQTNFANSIKYAFKRPMRFMQISDTHYGSEIYYNLSAQERLSRMVDWIIEEHKKQPLDFVVHTGDISYANVYSDGTDTNYIQKFYEEFMAKIPCPVYSLAGNHDGYTNEAFRKATGVPRQYTVEFDDIVLVMLDVYGVDGTYVGGDAEYLRSVLDIDANEEKKFILFAHYFNRNSDSADFKNLVENDDRIMYLVRGHTHEYAVGTYGSKPMVTGGNIAFWMDSGTKKTTYDASHAWGYVLHEMGQSGIEVKHVQPSGVYHLNNSTTDVINYTGATSSSTTVVSGSPVETYDFSVDRDKVNNNYYHGMKKNDSVYTLDDVVTLDWGADLDDVLDVGMYGAQSASKAASLDNAPVSTSGFKLVIDQCGQEIGTQDASRYIRQIVYPNSRDFFAFFRRYNPSDGTFSKWNKVVTTYQEGGAITASTKDFELDGFSIYLVAVARFGSHNIYDSSYAVAIVFTGEYDTSTGKILYLGQSAQDFTPFALNGLTLTVTPYSQYSVYGVTKLNA